jgi:RHS repeat-associated protein
MSSSMAYAPFGEQYSTAGTADPSFTSQNSDTVASLYDFTFRKHSPSQGRWISPDPLGVGAVDPTNPQSWNRYAYVANNPLSFVDPLGLLFTCDDIPYVIAEGGEIEWASFWDICIDSGGNEGGGSVSGVAANKGKPCLPGAGPPAVGQSRCPCANVTPAQFDYTTPQPYMDDNGNPVIQSAQQHIQQGHIYPGGTQPNGEQNTMYYVSPWPGTNAVFEQVKAYNAATYLFGQASQEGANGNITITSVAPPVPNPYWNLPGFIGYYVDPIMPEAIPLVKNKLVLASNCILVRTSYPTF